MLIVVAAMTAVFNMLPRSTYSEIEKRELTTFPDFSWQSLTSGSFAEGISSWFSDTEPFREEMMLLSMEVRNMERLMIGQENISFKAGDMTLDMDLGNNSNDNAQNNSVASNINTQLEIEEYSNELTAEEEAKIANAGILVIGKGDSVRALMAFGSRKDSGKAFAEAANTYYETFGESVHVYVMVIPTAIEFYCPDKAIRYTSPQRPMIMSTYEKLATGVTGVDVYTPLAKHASEDIFLRTDHHWTPLGAYYAAEAFAKVADVPFRGLDSYETKVVRNFVGTMYGYSGDIAIKKAPEDFYYYVPAEANYETTYIDFVFNKGVVVSEKEPRKGKYFQRCKDGSGTAYFVFMGGDKKMVIVNTDVNNSRRLLIIKDSFGNALPGYMFYSFNEVHVVDFRYFIRNMREYIIENGITDILIAMNVFNAASPKIAKRITNLLKQKAQTLTLAEPSATELFTEPEPITETNDEPAESLEDTILQEALPLPLRADSDSIE